MIDYIVITFFVFFVIFLVFGFNRQMQERAKKREEKATKREKFKKNQ